MKKLKKCKMSAEDVELITSAFFIVADSLVKREAGRFECTGNKLALLIAASELTEEMLQGRKVFVRNQLKAGINAYKKNIKLLVKKAKEKEKEQTND